MNDLDFIMLDIFELFDDFYCDVALIIWAIKMDALSTLLESTPIVFDPFQTIGNIEKLCLPTDLRPLHHPLSLLSLA